MSTFYASLTRIARLDDAELHRLPRKHWAFGDYVVVDVVRSNQAFGVELCSGRMAPLDHGDRVVGALGGRFATLELTGSWEGVGEDGQMHLLTPAGLLGKVDSCSPFLGRPVQVAYRGHLLREGRKQRMRDFALRAAERPWTLPTILVVGTSMSAGKTATCRVIVRLMRRRGLRVVAAKLTGAGRMRDAQTIGDAGAEAFYDFVDAGLPSTVCPREDYEAVIPLLLSHMQSLEPDLAVIESGASPLEPYNGEACMALLGDTVRALVVCASDPYSVVGLTHAFGHAPTVVCGVCTNTAAGIALVHRLSGCQALSAVDPAQQPLLDGILQRALGGAEQDGPQDLDEAARRAGPRAAG